MISLVLRMGVVTETDGLEIVLDLTDKSIVVTLVLFPDIIPNVGSIVWRTVTTVSSEDSQNCSSMRVIGLTLGTRPEFIVQSCFLRRRKLVCRCTKILRSR